MLARRSCTNKLVHYHTHEASEFRPVRYELGLVVVALRLAPSSDHIGANTMCLAGRACALEAVKYSFDGRIGLDTPQPVWGATAQHMPLSLACTVVVSQDM